MALRPAIKAVLRVPAIGPVEMQRAAGGAAARVYSGTSRSWANRPGGVAVAVGIVEVAVHATPAVGAPAFMTTMHTQKKIPSAGGGRLALLVLLPSTSPKANVISCSDAVIQFEGAIEVVIKALVAPGASVIALASAGRETGAA